MLEIGYAAALGKPIALGFSLMECSELRLARMTAAKVYWGTAPNVWQQIRSDWIEQKPERGRRGWMSARIGTQRDD